MDLWRWLDDKLVMTVHWEQEACTVFSHIGKDEPVYNNSASTITSVYHGGQLKMFTSHLAQPTSAGGRPEYYMTQIKCWAMTSDPETFRKGATAFRNARDWTKEQRDEAIARANEMAISQGATSATEPAGVGPLSSFTSEATPQDFGASPAEASYTIEILSQESRTTLNDVSYASDAPHHDSDSSIDELAYKPPAKRSSRHLNRSQQSQQKKRKPGGLPGA